VSRAARDVTSLEALLNEADALMYARKRELKRAR